MPQGGLPHKPVWPAQANGFLSGTGHHLLAFFMNKNVAILPHWLWEHHQVGSGQDWQEWT